MRLPKLTKTSQTPSSTIPQVPVSHQATGTGHGRTEKRAIQVMDAPEQVRALFPHVAQVFLTEQHVTGKVRKRKKNSRKQ